MDLKMRSLLPELSYLPAAGIIVASLAGGCAGSSSTADETAVTITLGQRVMQVATACIAACNAEGACFSDASERVDACISDCRARFDELEVDAPSVRACIDLAETELRCMAALSCDDLRSYYQAESGDDYPCAAEDLAWAEACAE